MRPVTALLAVLLIALSTPSHALQVSVCGDATYDLPDDRGAICASANPTPTGTACPLKGDTASADCVEGLASYSSGECVAPEDAVCALVTDTTWGCVLPSVGCGGKALTTSAPVIEDQCETWDYDEEESASSIDDSSLFDGNEDYDESWFVEVTKVTVLFACGEDTPTPAPTSEPTPAATSEIDTPTPAPTAEPTPAATMDTDTPTPAEPTPTADTTETPKATPASTSDNTDIPEPTPAATSDAGGASGSDTTDSAMSESTASSESTATSETESSAETGDQSATQRIPDDSSDMDKSISETQETGDSEVTEEPDTGALASTAGDSSSVQQSTGFGGIMLLSEPSDVLGTLKPADIPDLTKTTNSTEDV
ncbi:hypothetical protein PHYBOEH_003861 [Phytophthora boehmeriae]|uniref:Uncharacterized protein n=1 Tax=Phytophthora boehmeriae TaxID=109152 RepID=A0A8T1XC34_9STRA|nr:hypothetical protein PHYBOEH_003861 [Phytophthora boehmeriae]